MKLRKDQVVFPAAAGLTHRELRAIETSLGIFLDQPVHPLRTSNQQFGVYDEDEIYVGDVCAPGKHFLAGELRARIKGLFSN